MSLLFGRRDEARSLSFQEVFGRGGNITDITGSSVEAGARLIPLFACWRIIAERFASTPLIGYREDPDGIRQVMPRQPQLLAAPSPMGRTAFAWKYQAIVSLLARGNAYGLVTSTDGSGWPTQIEWLNPDLVSVTEQPDVRPRYYYEAREVPAWQWTKSAQSLIHVPWFLPPGKWVGLSPLGQFKTLIDTGNAAQTTARDWFQNGAIPSSHLKNDARTLDADEAETAKSRYMAAVGNRSPLVTGNDWSIESIGVPADQAQFIDTLKLTATQIASIYGIAPEKVGGEVSNSLHYTTRESNQADFNSDTMEGWYSRFEEVMTSLLPRPIDARFDLSDALRADAETRMKTHEIALRTGLETISEGRRAENKPPLTPDELAAWERIYHSKGETPPPATRDLSDSTEQGAAR